MPELDKVLKTGEKVLWSGKAESYEILDKTYKPVFIFRCILYTLICAAAVILYIAMAIASGAGIKWGFVALLIAAIGASPILFLYRSMQLKKYIYAATDLRLLIVADQTRGVEYFRIKNSVFKKDADGHTTLLCGEKAIDSKPGKWRETALFAKPDDDDSPCDKFAFYAIDQPEELKKVLEGKVPFADLRYENRS